MIIAVLESKKGRKVYNRKTENFDNYLNDLCLNNNHRFEEVDETLKSKHGEVYFYDTTSNKKLTKNG
jgi:hypothetical protein